jgi:DNA ligase (NAD+)
VARRDVREGDVVIIEKGGEIIPKVVGPVLDQRPAEGLPEWKMPTTCPFCESHLVKAEDEVVWRCENVSCPARIRRGLEHFASRYAMNIEGLGESLVDQLVTKGSSTATPTCIASTAEQLAALDGWARSLPPTSSRRSTSSRSAELWRVLHGIGIRHVGEGGAKALARAFLTMTALREAPLDAIERSRTLVQWSRARFARSLTSRAMPR